MSLVRAKVQDLRFLWALSRVRQDARTMRPSAAHEKLARRTAKIFGVSYTRLVRPEPVVRDLSRVVTPNPQQPRSYDFERAVAAMLDELDRANL